MLSQRGGKPDPSPHALLQVGTGAAASNDLTQAYPRVRDFERRLGDAERLARDELFDVLKDGITCPICLDRQKNLAFSCGHQVCKECSARLVDCPTCRVKISSRTLLFN